MVYWDIDLHWTRHTGRDVYNITLEDPERPKKPFKSSAQNLLRAGSALALASLVYLA